MGRHLTQMRVHSSHTSRSQGRSSWSQTMTHKGPEVGACSQQQGDPDGGEGQMQGAPFTLATVHLHSTPMVRAWSPASSRPTSRSARTAPPPASSAAGAARPAACAAAAGAGAGAGAGSIPWEREGLPGNCCLPPLDTLSSRDASEERPLLVN